jgi:tyrosyl-tRNA synthetase
MINTDPQKIDELLTRGVAEVIDLEHLRARLLSGEKLRIKLGIDPTSPNIHIGRGVVLHKLADFQKLGHQVVLIIGTFTGIIGDTSDKEAERPMIDEEVLKKNMETYAKQAGIILDMEQVEFRENGEWLSKLGYAEIGRQADAFSVSEMIARENIKKRLDAGKRVSLRELLYPLMQGYDSVAIEADVELGGTDQRFNLLAGRRLQPMYNQEPQDILMANLIMGTDGRKMSSSWGNTINLTDTPNDMFGKAMSVPDELIVEYLVHCTRVPMKDVKVWEDKIKEGVNPRDAKVFLASALVELYHGKEEAEKAVEYFVKTFSKGEVPEDVAMCHVADKQNIVDVITSLGLAESRSEARRKIEQGGVSIDGEKIMDITFDLDSSIHNQKVLKVGKKDFMKLVF